jgi:hypothetical protein
MEKDKNTAKRVQYTYIYKILSNSDDLKTTFISTQPEAANLYPRG